MRNEPNKVEGVPGSRQSIRSPVAAVCVLSSLVLFTGCPHRGPLPEKTVTAMGTAISIQVPYRNADTLDLAAHLAQTTATKLDGLINAYNPGSEVSKLNRVAASLRIPISRETYRLIDLALHYGELTDGAFDVTIAPLALLWGFGGGEIPPRPLSPALTRAGGAGVGLDRIRLDADGVISFTSPQTKISLAGVGKGYAADLSILEMRKEGIKNVLVNIGGSSIRCLGQKNRRTPWSVPLQHPVSTEDFLGVVRLPDGKALCTTRLYENYVTIAGKRYGHVLDPRTRSPAEGIAGVSVIAPTATEADALATALTVLGLEESPRILERFPRCDALIIPDRQPTELWFSGRFDELFEVAPAFTDAIRVLTPVS